MIGMLSKKQRTELRAVIIFVDSLNQTINASDFIFPEEASPVDVIYNPQKAKFQVTSVDGGPNKLIRHNKYEHKIKLTEIVDKYIIDPITKKYNTNFGYGVSDVILLIHSVIYPGRPGGLEADIQKRKKEITDISIKSGFKSIYLVFDMSGLTVPVYIPKS